jgi:hypothetical protein
MFSLRKSSNTVKSAAREDGYTARAAAVVCQFQQIIERESDCDYDALRAALLWARVPGHIVTLVNLRAVYNDSVYSSAQFAYASR